MRFKTLRLKGHWECSACGPLPPLQITPLNPNSFRCPKCGGELVFVPVNAPVDREVGAQFLANLKANL